MEEFLSKVGQVSGFNSKAIFIANAPLQEGGFNIAKNEGVMFVQGESADNYKIILHKSTLKTDTFKIPLLKSTINESIIDNDVIQLEQLIDSVILCRY